MLFFRQLFCPFTNSYMKLSSFYEKSHFRLGQHGMIDLRPPRTSLPLAMLQTIVFLDPRDHQRSHVFGNGKSHENVFLSKIDS